MAQKASSNVPNPRPNKVAPTAEEPENRDPKGINEHIKAEFYDVLAEPEDIHSFDCVWEMSEILYSCCRSCWYKLITLLCGCCIAMYWGLEFAPILFHNVWCLTPLTQVFKIICGFWCKNFWMLCIRCLVTPITRSMAPFFRFCGDGLNKRVLTPSIFPNWERKTKVVPVPKKPAKPKTPLPQVVVENQFQDYDKEKMARSVKRQLMLM